MIPDLAGRGYYSTSGLIGRCGGVRRDLAFPGPEEVEDGADRTEMVLAQVLSLPFDLVGDTVTLPFTLAGAKELADWNERRKHAGSIPSGADPS